MRLFEYVLCSGEYEFSFICIKYIIVEKNELLNSLCIEKDTNDSPSIIHLSYLKNIRSYETKQLNTKLFIMCETLDIP